MRITKLFYLLLVGVVLSWAACEDDDMPTGCDNDDSPTLFLSDGECTPDLLEFFDLTSPQTGDIPELPKECTSASEWGKTFRLDVPADGEVDIHFYNGSRAWANVQVFGVEGCAEDFAEAITPCITNNKAAQVIEVRGAGGYTDIYVTIDLLMDGPGTTPEAYIPDNPQQGGEYIAFGAYNKPPSGEVVSYRGINPVNELERLFKSCDGDNWQRVIIGTCNPENNLEDWRQEIGLTQSECYETDDVAMCALDVPPGLDPDLTDNAIAKKRPRQNTDDYFVDTDFIIEVPAPGGSGLIPLGELEQRKQDEFIDCLTFGLGTRATNDEADNLLITMIDSGVELGGNWDDIWNNHRNGAFKSTGFLDPGDLGYDFFNADRQPEDETGHGTNTAGALIGDYKADRPLTVVHHKIFGPNGESTYFGAVAAIFEAIKINSDVINMSWGAYPDERPGALECAVKLAAAKGITMVAAAGNDQENLDSRPQYPAVFSLDYPELISVASYLYLNPTATEVERVDEFSNFSPNAVSIAAYLSAQTPTYNGVDFNYLAGTSISSPLAAARIGEYLAQGRSREDYLASLPKATSLMDDVVDGRWQPICPLEGYDR